MINGNTYFGTYPVRLTSKTEYGIHMPKDIAGEHFSVYRNDKTGVLTLIPQGVKE